MGNKKIKLFEAFAGYGSQSLALKRLQECYPEFEFECVGWSEIDKYAIQAHDLLHPEDIGKNYGDISKVDWSEVPDFDFFTYSFPCTDISNAGLQKGLSESTGTRSSLLWECRKTIEIKKPKYLMMENVKALVSKKFLPEFNKWLDLLNSYGYKSYWKVLNAKDYGVPQNRERVFVFSCLDQDWQYAFPEGFELETFLEDILEENVDDKYYLSEKSVSGLKLHNDNHEKKGTGFI